MLKKKPFQSFIDKSPLIQTKQNCEKTQRKSATSTALLFHVQHKV